jgi:hypothetical protein
VAIARWREVGGIDKGPLLRRVVTHFDGSIDQICSARLHPNSIGLIYKRLVRRAWEKRLLGEMSEAELDRWLKAVSSHSIRVGVAQDNFAAGEGLPAIMQAYRWRDARTVMRYGAKLAMKSERQRASGQTVQQIKEVVATFTGVSSPQSILARGPWRFVRYCSLLWRATNASFGMTPLAWLRNFEEAPTATNINGLLERLRYVRDIGIDPSVAKAIPEFRFTQLVREGAVAPAFLLSDYSINRRRATRDIRQRRHQSPLDRDDRAVTRATSSSTRVACSGRQISRSGM